MTGRVTAALLMPRPRPTGTGVRRIKHSVLPRAKTVPNALPGACRVPNGTVWSEDGVEQAVPAYV